MGEVGGPQMGRERTAQGGGSEVLPEVTVEASRRETGDTFRVLAHPDVVSLDEGQPGARR